MSATPGDGSGDEVVVVPSEPGPLQRLPGARTPDEVDELLDDLFGPADDGGPGVADALLATGGGAAVVAGLVLSTPVVLAAGVGAVLLGSVLPARSLWRQAQQRRLAVQRAEIVGSGTPLRVSSGAVADLVGAYEALFALVTTSPERVGADERAAAHAAVADVATVLGGGTPVDEDEVRFVRDRGDALAALVARLSSSGASRDDAERRRARLAARQEVDRLSGSSSVDRLRQLADDQHTPSGSAPAPETGPDPA